MKHLSAFSGKGDPEYFLNNYQAAAKAEKWSDTTMLECIGLKLRKKAREWYENLPIATKPTAWEQFVTLFLEEFGDEDEVLSAEVIN